MSSATINVSLVDGLTAKTQSLSLPRSMTVADLQKLAGKKTVSFAVDGYVPAGAATLGDLYDTCATNAELTVVFTQEVKLGCCTSSGSKGY